MKPMKRGLFSVNNLAAACMVIVLLSILGVTAEAASVNDIMELSRAGLDEATIIEKVRAEGISSPLSVDDLIALKKGGFSANAIKSFIELENTVPSRTLSVSSTRLPAEPVFINAGSNSYLTDLSVFNQNDRYISLTLDSNTRTFYCRSTDINKSGAIAPSRSVTFRIPPGSYSIIVPEDRSRVYSMDVQPGSASMIVSARYYNNEPFNFLISQNGNSYYAGTQLNYSDPSVARTVYVNTPSVIHTTRYISTPSYHRPSRHHRDYHHDRYYCKICRRHYPSLRSCCHSDASYVSYTKIGKSSIFSFGLSNR